MDAEELAAGPCLGLLEAVAYGTGQRVALHFGELRQPHLCGVYAQCCPHAGEQSGAGQ